MQQRATLINDDTDEPLVAKEQLESSAYATCQPAHNAGRANAKMKQHLLQDIRRSAYVYRVDAAAATPVK